MGQEYPPRFVRLEHTAAADTGFKLALVDFWLAHCDIFVLTNDAYVGDDVNQDVPIYANDIYSIIHPVNIHDMTFKNYTGGSNCQVIILGPTLTKGKAKEYGIELPP